MFFRSSDDYAPLTRQQAHRGAGTQQSPGQVLEKIGWERQTEQRTSVTWYAKGSGFSRAMSLAKLHSSPRERLPTPNACAPPSSVLPAAVDRDHLAIDEFPLG